MFNPIENFATNTDDFFTKIAGFYNRLEKWSNGSGTREVIYGLTILATIIFCFGMAIITLLVIVNNAEHYGAMLGNIAKFVYKHLIAVIFGVFLALVFKPAKK